MTNESRVTRTKEQASAFFDLHAATREVISGTVVKAVEMQKSLTEGSADLARMMIDAAARSHREIAQMALDALSKGDPAALMTLAPRAAQTVMREAMDCANRATQSAQTLGKTVATLP